MTRSHLFAALLFAAGLPGALAAQQRPGGALLPVGELSGVVWDSLSATALAGSRVWIEGTMLNAVTDGRGRFRLDSVPAGARRLLFSHPDLDSIGFPQFGRRIQVSAGAAIVADLAVPSLATIATGLCNAPLPAPEPGAEPVGIVFGSVQVAGSTTRLAGARVEVSWVRLDFTDGRLVDLGRSALNVRSDSLGNFYVCGVPTRRMVAVAAATAASATGRLDVLVGERRVLRQDLHVALDTAMTLDSAGRLAGRAVVTGEVRSTTGAPLPGAQALVDDAGEPARSDGRGRFVLRDLPAGTHMLMVRAIGYGAARFPVHLAAGDTLRVSATLRGVTLLDTLFVTARRTGLVGELTERLRVGEAGHALFGEQLRNATQVSAALLLLPSIDVLDDGRNMAIATMMGSRRCAAHVWIDGLRSDAVELRSLQPRTILAVEWFPRGSTVPVRYQPPSFDHCGVLLVWTDALPRG